jgi:hypothetical protein
VLASLIIFGLLEQRASHFKVGWVYKSIHTESSPAVLKLYQAIDYIEMPFNDPEGYEGSLNDIAMGKLL